MTKSNSGLAQQALYLPYLYTGGQFFLNGQLLASLRASSVQDTVRWERPHLWRIPAPLIQAGANELWVKLPQPRDSGFVRMPVAYYGVEAVLTTWYEKRLFWVRTLPQITLAVCILVAVFLIAIWMQRPEETLFGLLGLGLLLWGVRTLTFTIEVMPTQQWLVWRGVYHAATGGFVIVMAFFALRFANMRWPRVERLMLIYWAIGPLWLLWAGLGADGALGRVWMAGIIPIACLILVMVLLAYKQHRSGQALALVVTTALAVLAGIHDYLMASGSTWLNHWWPAWANHRLFLLHHTANLLLLTTAGIMTARFVATLGALQTLNNTLEIRIAERERQLADSFAERAKLERGMAAEEERQRIMQDMHDGLGSRLFTSLSRVERGGMLQTELTAMLKGCIDDMRLVLDALAPLDAGFGSAVANFRHRWSQQLKQAGIQAAWHIDDALDEAVMTSHQRLQILYILQEALTNVLKHAQASRVDVGMSKRLGAWCFEVKDNGVGLRDTSAQAGRGLRNISARAKRIGAGLSVDGIQGGTSLTLSLPVSG